MKAPATKKENYQLFNNGVYGNHTGSWSNAKDALRDTRAELFAIRTHLKGARCDYDIPRAELLNREKDFLKTYQKQHLNISTMAPDDAIIFQGEAMRTYQGLVLTYSTIKRPMRIALAQETLHAQGFNAWNLCSKFMDAVSWENFNRLLDFESNDPKYGPIVEFSVYDRPVGILGWNSLFWEVRRY